MKNIGIITSNRCYNHESNRTNQIYIYIYIRNCLSFIIRDVGLIHVR